MTTCSITLLSEGQTRILEDLVNASLTPKVIVTRAKLILLHALGMPPSVICKKLEISYTPVYKWLNRWLKAKPTLDQIEKEKTGYDLKKEIINTLKDASRSGAPCKFTEEQVLQIIALACTSPETEDLPVSHWSCRMLAEHAQRLGLVKSISYKQINNFLKSGGVKTS